MDDLPSHHPNFAGPATASTTPEWNLDAGVLQTIQQVLGCPDFDRLPGNLADRPERLIALPGPGAEALDVDRLGRPAKGFRRVDRGVHQSRRPAAVDMRSLRLATDERRDVELLSKAIVIEMNVRVALEPQKGDEGRSLEAAERVMQLDALFEQLEMGAVGEQRRNADAARDQQVLDRVLGRRKIVRGHGD